MFRFEVKLTEDDYLEFNKFHALYSLQSEKTVKMSRSTFTILPLIMWLLTTLMFEFSWTAFIFRGIVMLSLSVFFFFFTKRMIWSTTKRTVKRMLKKGNRLFSPDATLEFNEDVFVETTEINKTECKYSAIEHIYLANGKIFYLYTNPVQAYLLPVGVFTSAAQYNSFVDFIQKKTNKQIMTVNEKR